METPQPNVGYWILFEESEDFFVWAQIVEVHGNVLTVRKHDGSETDIFKENILEFDYNVETGEYVYL